MLKRRIWPSGRLGIVLKIEFFIGCQDSAHLFRSALIGV
jgi:hypothetical protein